LSFRLAGSFSAVWPFRRFPASVRKAIPGHCGKFLRFWGRNFLGADRALCGRGQGNYRRRTEFTEFIACQCNDLFRARPTSPRQLRDLPVEPRKVAFPNGVVYVPTSPLGTAISAIVVRTKLLLAGSLAQSIHAFMIWKKVHHHNLLNPHRRHSNNRYRHTSWRLNRALLKVNR
jgi:hypothetical protein